MFTTWTQLISEQIYDGFRLKGMASYNDPSDPDEPLDRYVEVFLNPTWNELRSVESQAEWGRSGKEVRAVLSQKGIFVWKSNFASHGEIMPKLTNIGTPKIPIYVYFNPALKTGSIVFAPWGPHRRPPSSGELKQLLPVSFQKLFRKLRYEKTDSDYFQ